jgi:hypothetical protein
VRYEDFYPTGDNWGRHLYWRKRYMAYLESEAWNEMREAVMWVRGKQCECCGKPGTDLHHKHYRSRLGHERPCDLEWLCRSCHEAKHPNRNQVRRPTWYELRDQP